MIKPTFAQQAKILITLSLCGFGVVYTDAQDKRAPGKGDGSQATLKTRGTIPLVRVRPQPSISNVLGLGISGRRAVSHPSAGPTALSPEVRVKLLRESGIEITDISAPREFRLSPRQPYVSSSAYLFCQGDVEFNASADSMLLRLPPPQPTPQNTGFSFSLSGWQVGNRQPDPQGFIGVLVRMERGSRYLADFSVSSGISTIYQVTVSGAEGSGNFPKEAGGQHVLMGLESAEGGYTIIKFSARYPFTFHNVVVTKLD
jgi:hypothetical protein